jgi:4-diphosphocytidyl-2-C-methyl-D-erythritol kinase
VTRPEVSTLLAPGKLTLSLRVTGVRADGYHLLDAEMVSVDLADTLEIADGSGGITLVDEVVGGQDATRVPPGGQNLVSRALDLLGRRAAVRLVKRIPPGAGLGGGSADAAAVLRWGGRPEVALAVRLGADVPFCLRGGRARVRGMGEIVEPLAFEDRRFVMLLPPYSVSTAAVYKTWDEQHRLEGHGGRDTYELRDDAASGSGNDLERAALEVVPQLAGWRDRLFQATGIRPRLAGSGSAWFVEGDPSSTGLGGRRFLTLGPERASLISVRTIPPEPVR